MLDAEAYQIERSRATAPLFYRAPYPVRQDGAKPRDFQFAGCEYALARDNCLIADEPGVGKTLQGILISNAIGAKRTLVVCPASLRLNWRSEIDLWSTIDNVHPYVVQKAGDGVSSEAPYVITSYDLLRNPRILDAVLAIKWDHVILDECFPAGTMVATEDGQMDIATLVNERRPVRVWAMGPQGLRLQRVARYVRTPAPANFVEVRAEEHYITCTPNHKLWSANRGYIRADAICPGDILRVASGIHANLPQGEQGRAERASTPTPGGQPGGSEGLRTGVSGGSACGRPTNRENGALRAMSDRPGGEGHAVLRSILLRKMAHNAQAGASETIETASERRGCTQAEGVSVSFGADDRPQFRSGVSGQSGRYIEVAERPVVDREARRERLRDGAAEGVAGGPPVAGSVDGAHDIDGWRSRREPSQLLQGGYRTRGEQDGDRGGRVEPQHQTVALSGSSEDGRTRLVRVEGVQVVQRGSAGVAGGSGEAGNWVYNIEVEQDHNYFANGVQVSNCHAIKDVKRNKRTRAIYELRDNCDARFTALSGTPSPNQPIEMYNLCRILDWSTINFMSVDDFRNEYYDEGEGMVRSAVWDEKLKANVSKVHWSTTVRNKPTNLADLQRRLRSKIMIRRLKEDVHTQLPSKQFHLVPLPMTSEIKAALKHPGWEQAAKLYELDPAGFEADLPIDGEVSTARRLLGEAKVGPVMAYIDDLLDSGVEKLVVSAWHSSVLAVAKAHLARYGLVYMDGKTGMGARQKAVEQFQNDPKIRVILGQTAVIGEGHTLHAAQDVVLLEPDWVPGRVQQAVDRIHRLGQKGSHVIAHLPIAPGTLDERIVATAVKKDQSIFQALDAQ